ncbi:hypothetical protein [uncultured Bacteroides sp.]|uniref:hypothetical protein n=1 Tax=uncultured Bacteroides sp. TaxID=162156 RepID=UPI0026749627|nr:hypothetical protein [uncultured Bacteroides sp.]
MELSDWFKGFEKGIAQLSPEQREVFFGECGKNCVKYGTLQICKELYESTQGDLDNFFLKTNELPGVRCEIVKKGFTYHLYFMECTCELCRKGYVFTPLLCECSRQSILYVLQSLWKDRVFCVTLCNSILQGNQDCKMKIEIESNAETHKVQAL